jgi:hypothetical protein
MPPRKMIKTRRRDRSERCGWGSRACCLKTRCATLSGHTLRNHPPQIACTCPLGWLSHSFSHLLFCLDLILVTLFRFQMAAAKAPHRRPGHPDLKMAAKDRVIVISKPLPPSRKSLPSTRWHFHSTDSSASSIAYRDSFGSNRLEDEPSTQRENSGRSSLTTADTGSHKVPGIVNRGYFREDLIVPRDLHPLAPRPSRLGGKNDPESNSRRSTSISSSSRSETDEDNAVARPRTVLSMPRSNAPEPLATPMAIPKPVTKAPAQTLTHQQIRGKRQITGQKFLVIGTLTSVKLVYPFWSLLGSHLFVPANYDTRKN